MRVIITGAAGRIGREMIDELCDSHQLCLLDRIPVEGRPSVVVNLARLRVRSNWNSWFGLSPASSAQMFDGADVVLHLAADASPRAPWERLLHDNIQATWNVINAAASHRIKRVVYASSNWAVKGLEQQLAPACYASSGPKIGSDAPPRPLTPYGLSKAIGEQIGRMAVDEGRLASFIAVRIGHYQPDSPRDEELRRLWIGAGDLRRLLRRCVEANIEGFHVIYGISGQRSSPFDLSYTRSLLCWDPQQAASTDPAASPAAS